MEPGLNKRPSDCRLLVQPNKKGSIGQVDEKDNKEDGKRSSSHQPKKLLPNDSVV